MRRRQGIFGTKIYQKERKIRLYPIYRRKINVRHRRNESRKSK
jgi:hypothetical protein